MSTAFLTKDEIETLTGLTQPAAQMTFLKKNSIHFTENKQGKVVVARAWLDNAPFYSRDRVTLEAANTVGAPAIGKLGG